MVEEIIDCVNVSDMPAPPKIMVIGVGGGGGNAVKYMHDLGIYNVMFMVCNTDAQALMKSPIPLKMQLGKDLTRGLGAGNKPERGRDAAVESIEDIRTALKESGADMVFVTAGMGGGTGTGAAPVIAKVAKEEGILTTAIVTIPFRAEGEVRIRQASTGVEEIRKSVDSLLIIDNENVNLKYGELPISKAFGRADDILATAAKGIAEIITRDSFINVDFADVKTTMSNSGIALMGYSVVDSNIENLAVELAEAALNTSLLNKSDILGAKNILVNISWREAEPKLSELHAILGHIQAAAGSEASIIWGAGYNESLEENQISVTIVATGFQVGGDMPDDMFIDRIKPVAPVKANDDKYADKQENTPIDRINRFREQFQETNTQQQKDVVVKVPFDSEEKSVEDKKATSSEDDDIVIVFKDVLETNITNNPVVEHAINKTDNNRQHIVNNSITKEEVIQMSLDDEEVAPKETNVVKGDNSIDTRDADDDFMYREKLGLLFSEDQMPGPTIATRDRRNRDVVNNTTGRLSFRDLSIDELEDAPAYRRRKVPMFSKSEQQGKVSKVQLKDDDFQ